MFSFHFITPQPPYCSWLEGGIKSCHVRFPFAERSLLIKDYANGFDLTDKTHNSKSEIMLFIKEFSERGENEIVSSSLISLKEGLDIFNTLESEWRQMKS